MPSSCPAAPRKSRASGEPAASLANTIAKHRTGRRWAALTLRHVAGWGLKKIAQRVKPISYKVIKAWERKLSDTGDVLDNQRAAHGPAVDATELEKLKDTLTSGGTGQHKFQSLRRAYPKLKAAGDVSVSRETLRRALHSAHWSCQKVRKRLPLHKA